MQPTIGLGPDPYGPRDSTSLFAPSTTDYDSRSSAAYTYDDDDYDEGAGEDESISPFSDLHRPRPTILASRNNVHQQNFAQRRTPYYSPSVISASASETDSMLSSDHDGTARRRRVLDPDEESVITLSSRISKMSGKAPSSSGATYGGAHDDDDEDYREDDDDDHFEVGRAGDEEGFDTEQQDDDDDDCETEGGRGYDTEQGFDTETEREDDEISLNTTASGRSHRP